MALSFIFSVAACTSPPREVTASLPLVSHSQSKPNKKIIPQQYWSDLENVTLNYIEHPTYQIQLGELYTSALGLTCRELTIVDKEQQVKRRIVCKVPFLDENNKQDEAWFLEKEIIESSSYVDL